MKLCYCSKKIIFIFFFLFFFSARSQNINDNARFRLFSIENGLSQGTIRCITQDSTGFLWVGTEDGLNRYDGYTFQKFKNVPDNPNTISDNFIYTIHEDKHGHLWIGTNNGMNQFIPEKQIFHRYKHNPKDENSLLNNEVHTIQSDEKGILWIGTLHGLNRFDPVTNQFKSYKIDISPVGNSIRSILAEKDSIWIGTEFNGLYQLSKKNGSLHKIPLLRNNKKINKIKIWSIYRDKNHNLWIGTFGYGLFKRDNEDQTFVQYHDKKRVFNLQNNDIWSFTEDSQSNIWIGTGGEGLYVYQMEKDEIIHFASTSNQSNFIQDPYILSLYPDKSGIVWIGTGNGLYHFDPYSNRFIHLSKKNSSRSGLPDSTVWSVYEDANSNVWIGTNDGLCIYNQKTKIFTNSGEKKEGKHIAGKVIKAILEDSDRNYWIGTQENGLAKYNPSTNKWKKYRYDQKDIHSLSDNEVKAIFEDSSKRIWIGTGLGGLCLYDKNKDNFLVFKNTNDNKKVIGENRITCIFEDSQKKLWLGTMGKGICQFDPVSRICIEYNNSSQNQSKISNNRIFTITEDAEHHLWIGTGCGLNRFNPKTETFKQYTEKDGLPNDVIYGILIDAEKNLWLSTNNGLSKFNSLSETFVNYDRHDGLQGNEFNTGAYYKSQKTGLFYFGGVNGLTIFDPDHLIKNQYVPSVVLSDFKVFNKSYPFDKPFYAIQTIDLNYKQNFFEFHFSALSYSNPAKNSFKYKLDGIDKDWIDAGTRRFATYTDIDGGDYTFFVRASNNDNIWNNNGLAIPVHIKPPFWETKGFRIFLMLFLGIMVNLGYIAGKKIFIILLYWRKSFYIGHFKIIRQIGKGGMGTVYEAQNVVSKRIVALKVMNEESENEDAKVRFIQEGKICDEIKHPGIIQVFERGEHNGKLYYSMEHYPGTPLGKMIPPEGLDVNISLLIYKTVMEILHFIHQNQVVHRDIKPENILIHNSLNMDQLLKEKNPEYIVKQNLKLLDFGIAKALNTKTFTQTGLLVGTINYIPPEYLSLEKKPNPEYDYYSTGMVLYEMLTGTMAYKGDEPVKIMYSILYRMPPPPKEINPEIPEHISDFVMELIQKENEKRLKDYETITNRLQKLF